MPVRPQFTPEQLETLREFADHVRSGKHFLIFMFNVSAVIGACDSAIIAWLMFFPHH